MTTPRLCKNGHDLNDPATRNERPGRGVLECRACSRAHAKARYASDPELRARIRVESKARHERTYVRKTSHRPGFCRADLHDLTDPANRFPDKNTRTGRVSYACRPCRDAANRQWREDNREQISAEKKGRTVFQRYGFTREGLDALWAEQGGRCAICREVPLPGRHSHLTYEVDHDHACCPGSTTCGRCIRGLICSRCNSGLGQFRDDPSLMRRASDYAERGGAMWAEDLEVTPLDEEDFASLVTALWLVQHPEVTPLGTS